MKTLKYYIVFFLVSISFITKSQIIYTEFNPTIKIPSITYLKIDFNSDNIFDVIIQQGGYKSNPGCPATIYSMIGFSAASDTIMIINKSQEINIFDNFDSFQDLISSTCIYNGFTILPCYKIVTSTQGCSGSAKFEGLSESIENKFFVVKFKINNNYHYGWIKFSKSVGVNMEIKSFAYNTSPATPFIIDDPIPTSIQEIYCKNEISIYPNPFKNEINISSKEVSMNTISIFDILGNIIYSSKNETNEVTIPTTSLPKGIYLVKINTKDKTISKYIIK